jgi:hypothetical protein
LTAFVQRLNVALETGRGREDAQATAPAHNHVSVSHRRAADARDVSGFLSALSADADGVGVGCGAERADGDIIAPDVDVHPCLVANCNVEAAATVA